MAIPNRFQSGFRLQDGNAVDVALATPQWQTNDNIVALAGGALNANTPVLTLGANEVGTVASGNDSVVLPSAVAGSVVYMLNAGANTVKVYGNGSDTINGTAGGTGVTYATTKRVLFIAIADGEWIANVMTAT
jgi:hypothetical protein